MHIENVKLSKLHFGPTVNVRHGQEADGLVEMVASIKSVGLLHPLIGRPRGEHAGEYEIIDGGRRLQALRKIHGKKDPEIEVIVKADDAEHARSMSLAANVVRVALHPIDEYEAYARMAANGKSTAEIANQFGVKEKWVRQRLQLAALAPEIREAWRTNKMTMDQAEALSSVPNYERQREVWKEATKSKTDTWRREPRQLRQSMTSAGVNQKDGRVKFVGLDAYLAAGGVTSDDLFTDERILLSEDVLNRLVDGRLSSECERLRGEGWSFAVTEREWESIGGKHWNRRTIDLSAWMTPEERAVVSADKKWHEIIKIEGAAIERAAASAEARALSGVVVELSDDGEIEFDWCVYKPGDDAKPPATPQNTGDETDSGLALKSVEQRIEDDTAPKINWALREALSESLTRGLAKALSESPDVALSAVLASLLVTTESYGPSPMRLSTSDAWAALLPDRDGNNDKDWSVEFLTVHHMPLDARMKLLGVLTARTLDLRHPRYDHRRDWDATRAEAIKTLAKAIPAEGVAREIEAAFDREAYFKRVSLDECRAAIVEIDGRDTCIGKKKADLVTHATARAKASEWLPVELRTPHYKGPGVAP